MWMVEVNVLGTAVHPRVPGPSRGPPTHPAVAAVAPVEAGAPAGRRLMASWLPSSTRQARLDAAADAGHGRGGAAREGRRRGHDRRGPRPQWRTARLGLSPLSARPQPTAHRGAAATRATRSPPLIDDAADPGLRRAGAAVRRVLGAHARRERLRGGLPGRRGRDRFRGRRSRADRYRGRHLHPLARRPGQNVRRRRVRRRRRRLPGRHLHRRPGGGRGAMSRDPQPPVPCGTSPSRSNS